MKKKIIIIYILNVICIKNSVAQQANTQILTFFIRPYIGQDIQDVQAGEKFSKKLKIPGKSTSSITKKMFKELYNTGIFATYMGNSCVSDMNGQIKFPRKKKSNVVNMVITQSVKPVFMHSNTIHHFVISKPEDAKWYRFEKTMDKISKKYSWQVSEKPITGPNLPADILLISSKPKHIFVPTGTFTANDDPNLTLPDIYAKNGISTALNAIKFLKVKKYFSPVKSEYKFDTQSYQELLV